MLDLSTDFSLKIIWVPRHTTDSVMYYSEKDHVAFVGDTIFKGSIGNYRYPGAVLRICKEALLKRYLPCRMILYCIPDIQNRQQWVQKKEDIVDGSCTTITADFRKYPCMEDSIANHSAYLLCAKNGSKLQYDGLKGCTDYRKAV